MCLQPRFLKKAESVVPCGKCSKCRKRLISAWQFRLEQEYRDCNNAHFVTLTYRDDELVFGNSNHASLLKRDLQLFFKRLRKAKAGSQKSNIKYYAVGEYGGRTKRPHYHAIIYNANYEQIEKAWEKGHVHFGQVSEASIGYCLKYMYKTATIRNKSTKKRGVEPEFGVMSKGLGIGYIDEKNLEWHMSNYLEKNFITKKGGIKIALPRYYKEKMYYQVEKLAIQQFYQELELSKYNRQYQKITTKTERNKREKIIFDQSVINRKYQKSLL